MLRRRKGVRIRGQPCGKRRSNVSKYYDSGHTARLPAVRRVWEGQGMGQGSRHARRKREDEQVPAKQETEARVSWLTRSRLNILHPLALTAALWRAKTSAVSFCKTRRCRVTPIHVPQFVRSSNHTTWFCSKSAIAMTGRIANSRIFPDFYLFF